MESDKIKGVVIITLPPPDNPSVGKSITAFTLTDDFTPDPPRESVAVHQEVQEPYINDSILPTNLPIQAPLNQRSIPLSRELFAGTPRKVVVLLGIALVAIYLYSSDFPETIQELRSSDRKNDDDRPTSLLFPLYFQSGLGDSSEFQLKLGKTVGVSKDNLAVTFNDVLGVQPSKLISSTLKTDSSAVFPVRGDIYPDGYAILLFVSIDFYLCPAMTMPVMKLQ